MTYFKTIAASCVFLNYPILCTGTVRIPYMMFIFYFNFKNIPHYFISLNFVLFNIQLNNLSFQFEICLFLILFGVNLVSLSKPTCQSNFPIK